MAERPRDLLLNPKSRWMNGPMEWMEEKGACNEHRLAI